MIIDGYSEQMRETDRDDRQTDSYTGRESDTRQVARSFGCSTQNKNTISRALQHHMSRHSWGGGGSKPTLSFVTGLHTPSLVCACVRVCCLAQEAKDKQAKSPKADRARAAPPVLPYGARTAGSQPGSMK